MTSSDNSSKVFLSYSRQQLYFAESLALSLQEAGFVVWFDIQQLTPGYDWKQKINLALENSNTFVLVGSRAAMESPNVKEEWEFAQAMGHFIAIAIFEPFKLPKQLKPHVILDLRDNFDEGVERLSQLIVARQSVFDSLPTLPAPRISQKMEFHVRLIRFVRLPAIAGGILWGLGTLFFILYPNTDKQSGIILFLLFLMVFWFRWMSGAYAYGKYFRRENVSPVLIYLRCLALVYSIIQLAVLYAIYQLLTNAHVSSPIWPALLFTALFPFWIGSIHLLWLWERSEQLYRWLPYGQASYKFREHIIRQHALKKQSSSRSETFVKCYIHCAVADSPLANKIQTEFGKYGILFVNDPIEASYHILLITESCTRSSLQEIADTNAPCISLLVGNINSKKLPSNVRKLQYLDIRNFSTQELTKIARTLPEVLNNQSGINREPNERFLNINDFNIFFNLGIYSILYSMLIYYLGSKQTSHLDAFEPRLIFLPGVLIILAAYLVLKRKLTIKLLLLILGIATMSNIYLGISYFGNIMCACFIGGFMGYLAVKFRIPKLLQSSVALIIAATLVLHDLRLFAFIAFFGYVYSILMFTGVFYHRPWLPQSLQSVPKHERLQ